MPTFYAGSKDQTTPIVAPGTQDYSAVYPPEYQKQAWQWEEERRAAEREREMMDMAGGPENFAQAQKAIAAAEQFQTMRQWERAKAEGDPDADAKYVPRLLKSNPPALARYMQSQMPKAAAITEERKIGGKTFAVVTQPSGHVQYIDVTAKPIIDPTEQALNKEITTAKGAVATAAREAGTYNKGTPVVSKGFLGGMREFVGLPTSPTTNINYPDPDKMTLTQNKLASAQEQLAKSEAALAAYRENKRAQSAAPGAPTGAGVVAPPQPSARPTKPLTKEALKEARQAAGGDKAAAQQWLLDNGYSL